MWLAQYGKWYAPSLHCQTSVLPRCSQLWCYHDMVHQWHHCLAPDAACHLLRELDNAVYSCTQQQQVSPWEQYVCWIIVTTHQSWHYCNITLKILQTKSPLTDSCDAVTHAHRVVHTSTVSVINWWPRPSPVYHTDHSPKLTAPMMISRSRDMVGAHQNFNGWWPFQGWFAIRELALAMINLSTKFEVSISTNYKDI